MSEPNKNWLHRRACRHAGNRYPCLFDVFPLTLKDRTWSVASDLRGALAVDDDARLVTRWPPADGHTAIGRILHRLFAVQPKSVRTTRLLDLKAWLASPNPAAEGSAIGVLAGQPVDTALLQHLLPAELAAVDESPDPVCRYGIASASADPAAPPKSVVVVGRRWRLFLMGMEPEEPGPHPVYLPRLGDLWAGRHTPLGRARIADFYADSGEPEYADHVRLHPFPW